MFQVISTCFMFLCHVSSSYRGPVQIYCTNYPPFSCFMNLTETHMIMKLGYCLFIIANIFPNLRPGYWKMNMLFRILVSKIYYIADFYSSKTYPIFIFSFIISPSFVCVYVCMHKRVSVCLSVCMHVCMCVCMHALVCMYVRMLCRYSTTI